MKYFRKKMILTFLIMLSVVLVGCKKTNKVYFITNGGESLESEKITMHSDFNSTHVPKKDDYVFMGWFIDESLETEYKPNEHNILSELRLYAKWQLPTEATKNKIVQLYEEAYEKHTNSKDMEVVATGIVKTNILGLGKVEQKLKSTKRINDNQVYQLTASHGEVMFIPISMFFEVNGNKNDISVRLGTSNKDLEIGKVEEEFTPTIEEHKNKYGVMPNELNYIVNSETVIEAKDYVYLNNKHQFTLILDNEKSVVNYLKNIKGTNTYDSKPAVFESIRLTVTIDETGNFEKIIYEEKYEIEVKAPVIGWTNQSMSGNITEIFKYK